MKYVTIDGDDIGQRITSAYLQNDLSRLIEINEIVRNKTDSIASYLQSNGFVIIFCAADGVAAYTAKEDFDVISLFDEVRSIAAGDISFSAGVGKDLREAYIALLSAKSSGKGCLHNFENLENNV
jgi:hypothetical protein